MEKQQPSPIPAGSKAPRDDAKAALPAEDTNVVRQTAIPPEQDALWEELGSTRVTGEDSDSSSSGVQIGSPANFTEISASRVLGKNLTTIGDFQLVKKLGEGAMGAVYKAVQTNFKRTVALKVLFPHVAKVPKLVERLYREGRVMGKLDHPNIVQAFAVGEAEGCHYVAMEYVSGQSMQKWLTRLGKLTVADAVRIVLDCARALQYAHGQTMVHRDIKPDNILLTRTGIVKVADLGMVKIDDEEMALTQTGHAVGTPWYMPLEQARNAKDIDGRSDIYALGCTLYAFLTGHPPFIGRTIVDVIQAKENGTFAPARQTNPNVPERLDLIIAKATAKSPKNRYQTCDDLIKDLESLDVAAEVLSFVPQRRSVDGAGSETPMPGRTSVVPLNKEVEMADVAAAAVDADVWYVQMKMPDGSAVARKYNTGQLQKMLSEGTIKPTARASHTPDDGFRSLATYKEFQGTAMSLTTKKAADKTTAKYRGIYKKLEEKDRELAAKERADARADTAVRANTRYWFGILMTFGPYGLIAFILLISLILIVKFAF